jgi:hypothetical protein
LWPKQTIEQAPPSLWVGLASLGCDVKVLQEEMLKLGGVRVGPGDLKLVEASMGIELSGLWSATLSAVSAVEAKIAEVKGVVFSEFTQHKTITGLSEGLSEVHRIMTDHISRSDASLRSIKQSMDSGDKGGMYSVKYANDSFSSVAEVGAWAETLFEGGPFPFGAFVDVYSVLQRVTSYKDIAYRPFFNSFASFFQKIQRKKIIKFNIIND